MNIRTLVSVAAPVPILLGLARPALADEAPAAPAAPAAAPAAPADPAAAPAVAPAPADPNVAPPPNAAPAPAGEPTALATTTPAAPPPDTRSSEEIEEDKHPVKFGALLGLVAIPRPLEIEVGIRYKKSFTVGLQYSWFPQVFKFGDVDVNFSALQLIPRWHPFKGSFYLGLGLGYQFLNASTELSGSKVEADANAFIINPQIGWLWVWDFGLALGLNLGVQIPFGGDPGIKGVPTTGTADVDKTVKDLDDATKLVAKTPLPVIDLLKIGFYF